MAASAAAARRAQGVLEGKLAAIGFEQRQAFIADAWTQEALSTAAIEGERLDAGPGGFDGGLSTRKYESLTGAARATASRDLLQLQALGLLQQTGAGRSTRYHLGIAGPD